MDKKIRKELTEYLCSILNSIKMLEFTTANFIDDEDINFFITLNLNSSLKNRKRLSFLLYCSNKTTITIYCPTLYKIKAEDSIMYTLNSINIVNSKIAIGKIYINNDNGSTISYINRIIFNDLTTELTADLLKEYITSFLATSFEFYQHLNGDIK